MTRSARLLFAAALGAGLFLASPGRGLAQHILALEEFKESPRLFMLELKFGPYLPRIDDAYDGTGPYEEIFGDSNVLMTQVEFDVQVYSAKEDRYRALDEVSPVVRTLASDQFDDYVKRVRIFAHPRVVEDLRRLANVPQLVAEAIDRMEP